MCFNRRRRRLTSLLAYLQVNIEGRPSATMTSLDDRKWSGAHADGGPMWSMVRLMLDVSLLRRITFVVLALSVLLCYLGQSLAVVVYFLKQLYTCCCYADLCVCVCVCVCVCERRNGAGCLSDLLFSTKYRHLGKCDQPVSSFVHLAA